MTKVDKGQPSNIKTGIHGGVHILSKLGYWFFSSEADVILF